MKPAHASSEDLNALLARWVAHKQTGNLAFSRAIFRSYTRDSLFGRLVRRHVVLNPLAPMLLKEIHYRLLVSPLGPMLRSVSRRESTDRTSTGQSDFFHKRSRIQEQP